MAALAKGRSMKCSVPTSKTVLVRQKYSTLTQLSTLFGLPDSLLPVDMASCRCAARVGLAPSTLACLSHANTNQPNHPLATGLVGGYTPRS
jgi:hypothetical protein